MKSHDDSHGQTPAAWTAVILMLIGSVISSVAVVWAKPLVFWIGILVVAIGAVAGLVLRSAGYGQAKTASHVGGR